MGRCCDCRSILLYCMSCRPPTGETRRPCSWPHGCCYTFMAIMSAFGGCMMNYFVLNSCYMQRIKLINPVTGDTIPGSERGYGFFARETDYGLESDYADCSRYTPDEIDLVFDNWMNAGKFFAFVSMIVGSIACLVLMSTCMVAYSADMFERWLFWAFVAATCACGLIFLVFGSEYCQEHRCKVAPGSGYTITTFMFWLSTANSVKSMGGTMPERNKNKGKPNNPFKRNRGPKNNNKDDDDSFDDMDDLYFEDEADQFPLPEMTPEGRRRYQDAEEYANDTERAFARKYDADYDSDEDEDDYSYGEEEYDPNAADANDDDGRRANREYLDDDSDDDYNDYDDDHQRNGHDNNNRNQKQPQQQRQAESDGYDDYYDDDEEESESQRETFQDEDEPNHQQNGYHRGGQQNDSDHDDDNDDNDDQHQGYDRTPRVGDVDGPTIT